MFLGDIKTRSENLKGKRSNVLNVSSIYMNFSLVSKKDNTLFELQTSQVFA